MGTSKAYSPPVGGRWSDVKRETSRYIQQTNPPIAAKDHILSSFTTTLLATDNQFARLSSPASYGVGSSGAGRVATKIANAARDPQQTRQLLSVIAALPFQDARVEAKRIVLDTVADVVTLLDDSLARAALDRTLEKILSDCTTAEEVEEVMTNALTPEGLTTLLPMYFATLLFEKFCNSFYEKIMNAKGSEQCDRILTDLFEYVLEKTSREDRLRNNQLGSRERIEDYLAEVFAEVTQVYVGEIV